jgi:hypothetical protein
LWKAALLAVGGVAFFASEQWLWGAFVLGAAAWHYSRARSRNAVDSSDDADRMR